jgi:hypothetical protein
MQKLWDSNGGTDLWLSKGSALEESFIHNIFGTEEEQKQPRNYWAKIVLLNVPTFQKTIFVFQLTTEI